ncbi:LysR family transcriptional regulator [Streptomyces sp. SID3343]|nr:LysR family transcriptional regulator [Streptomyces sp. SID3343]
MSVLMVGSHATHQAIRERLRSPASDVLVTKTLRGLRARGTWADVANALIGLADHLDANEVAIDYERRRTLDYNGLLPPRIWRGICGRTGVPIELEHAARSLLFHRLSGLPRQSARAGRPIAGDKQHERAYLAWYLTILSSELDAEGHAYLARNGIHDEPVTWQPLSTLLPPLDPNRTPNPREVPLSGPSRGIAGDVPHEILAPALTGHNSWQPLERFVSCLGHHSIVRAAETMGLSHGSLNHQIVLLEAAYGQPLLIRATKAQTMRPTAFGQQVAQAVMCVLAG